MTILRVALLQMASFGVDQDANRRQGEDFCRRAKEQGAQLALFPEMWNIGYTSFDLGDPEAQKRWESRAISQDDGFITFYKDLARRLQMAIAITYLQRWEGGPRNAVSLIDRRGEIRLTYAKVHTCDFDWERALTPGTNFYVCSLDIGDDRVNVGAMICFDREFPESARLLMLKGAEIILTPNACKMEVHRLAQFRTRAYENMVGVALTNYAAPQENGHSAAYSPLVFDAEERSLDNCLVEAGEQEGIYMADFDLTAIRDFRQREGWGNAYRRPHLYGLLTATQVNPPFIRPDARREG